MTDDHPNAEDWRNRCERAEQECAELREEIARLREALSGAKVVAHPVTTTPVVAHKTANTSNKP